MRWSSGCLTSRADAGGGWIDWPGRMWRCLLRGERCRLRAGADDPQPGSHVRGRAPSLIPERPGKHREHGRKDARVLAMFYRTGEPVAIRIPTKEEEQLRDPVRCRDTFRREAPKSHHYIPKVLAGPARRAHARPPRQGGPLGPERRDHVRRGASAAHRACHVGGGSTGQR